MKLFKKLSAVLIALVLAFAMFAFAACGGGDDSNPNDNNNDNTNNNQQQGGSGGSGGGGGNEGGSGGSSDDTGDDADEVTPASIVAALEKAEIKFINFESSQERNISLYAGTSEEDAEEIESQRGTEIETNTYKIDVVNGNYDEQYKGTYTYDPSSEQDDYYLNNYTFKRGDYLFAYEQDSDTSMPDNVTDWSEITFTAKEIDEHEMVNNIDKLASAPRVNIALINLAKQTNSITIADGKATVDLNKLADKALEEIDADLQTVSSTTTLGAALEKDAIKTYLPILVNVLTADEIVSLAKLYLSTPGAPTYPLYAVFDGEDKVSPDANSTAWEYLIKLLKSEELKTAVNSVLTGMGIEGTIEADSLYDVSCKYVMGLVGQIMSMIHGGSGGSSSGDGDPQDSPSPSPQPVDPQEGQGNQGAGQPQPTLADTSAEPEEDEVKDALEVVHDLSEAATAEKLVVVSSRESVVTQTLTNMKLEYTLDGSDITAMTIKFDNLLEIVDEDTQETTSVYSKYTTDVSQTYSAAFSDTGSLADIDDATVEKSYVSCAEKPIEWIVDVNQGSQFKVGIVLTVSIVIHEDENNALEAVFDFKIYEVTDDEIDKEKPIVFDTEQQTFTYNSLTFHILNTESINVTEDYVQAVSVQLESGSDGDYHNNNYQYPQLYSAGIQVLETNTVKGIVDGDEWTKTYPTSDNTQSQGD